MGSIFTRIINREIAGYILEETDSAIAFLDVSPVAKGHTLVVPKEEVDYLFDLGSEKYLALWGFAQAVALKLGRAVPCKRVGVAVVGLEVPHAHVHLIPLQTVADLSFTGERLKLSAEEMGAVRDSYLEVGSDL